MANQLFEKKNVITALWHWKWRICIITLIGAIVSVVFTMPYFIHPQFKSTAVLYPANLVTYTDESKTEQMMEVLRSSDITFNIIQRFDLYHHYQIDSEKKYAQHRLMRKYEKQVNFSETAGGAIEMTVLDEDPQMASDIANAIIDEYNKKMRAIHSQKSMEQMYSCQMLLEEQQKNIDSLLNIVQAYCMKYGLTDRAAQVSEYVKAMAQGKIMNEARPVLDHWAEYGTELRLADSLLFANAKMYADVQREYYEHYRNAYAPITYANIVSVPYAADKKTYPRRLLMCIFTTLSTLVLASLLAVFLEGQKKEKRETVA